MRFLLLSLQQYLPILYGQEKLRCRRLIRVRRQSRIRLWIQENPERIQIIRQQRQQLAGTDCYAVRVYSIGCNEDDEERDETFDRTAETIFGAYSASFYANGSHRFKFDTTFVTTMAIFNLEHSDKTLRYGDSMSKVKKEAKKEIKKIFGSNYKYKFAYTGNLSGICVPSDRKYNCV